MGNDPSIRFTEIAVGHPRNRGQVIRTDEIYQYIQPETELYRSVYEFDDELVQHFNIRKTIRGYRGKYFLPQITFDIDRKYDTDDQCKDRARQLVEDLVYHLESTNLVHIWFSGRGYHIDIPDMFGFEPGNDLPDKLKATMTKYYPDVDMALYTRTSLVRVGYSYNGKSKRYKIPLTIAELSDWSIEEIKAKAETIRTDYQHAPFPDFEPIYRDCIQVPVQKQDEEISGPSVDAPTAVTTCVQRMYNEGPEPGSRNHKLLRITSAWRRFGIPKPAIIGMLQQWAHNMDPYTVQIKVADAYDKGYQYSCNEQMMKQYCDPRCIFFKNKDFTMEVHTAEELEQQYSVYLTNIASKNAINLREIYVLQKDFVLQPEDLVVVTGDSGLGKSAWVQGIIQYANLNPTLYLPLEMGNNLTFRRQIQISHHMTKDQVNAYYSNGHNGSLAKAIEHIRILATAPRLDAIDRLVAETSPKLLVVDTTDEIQVTGIQGDIEATRHRIIALKDLAKKYKIIVIAIHHLNKAGAVTGEITMHSLKGPGEVYQKADHVLAITGRQEFALRTLKSLKGRDEEPLFMNFMHKHETMEFIQTSSEGHLSYQANQVQRNENGTHQLTTTV